jgi:RNA polymerase sigma-70 factor (ECF subfamily)
MPSTVVPEQEHVLIHRAQQGDRPAFAQLVERYWDRLYRWLFHLAHDRHTAEDLTQDAFLKALAGLATFQTGKSFQAWLFRIAHNHFLNQKRLSRKVVQVLPSDLAARQDSPEETAMSREALAQLARAVGRLPNDFRAAFLLRVDEGMSFQEIAEVMEVTQQTVRWRVFKARQKLMEILAPELDRERA